MYPARSTAMSPEARSLWWGTRYDGAPHLCATQGRTLLQTLQRRLRADLPLIYTVGGYVDRRTNIDIDEQFGPHTFAGLVRWMEDLGPPPAIMDALVADFRRFVMRVRTTELTGEPVAPVTMACAIWGAVHWRLPFDALSIPAMDSWRWLTEIPFDVAAAGSIECQLSSTTSTPTYGPAPAPAAPAPRQSTTIPSTSRVPSDDTQAIIDRFTDPAAAPESSSDSTLLIGVVLAVLWDLARKKY